MDATDSCAAASSVDGEACRGVPEVKNGHRLQLGYDECRLEPRAFAAGGTLHMLAEASREDEVARLLALSLRREGGAEECRERDGAPLVALRSANDGVPSDFDGILGDDDSASREVDVADAERGDLTPAETGVSEEQDQSFVLAARCGEIADVLMAEVAMSAGDLAGESGASRDIGRHPPIANATSRMRSVTRMGAAPRLARRLGDGVTSLKRNWGPDRFSDQWGSRY
jgi:hypothetical protein